MTLDGLNLTVEQVRARLAEIGKPATFWPNYDADLTCSPDDFRRFQESVDRARAWERAHPELEAEHRRLSYELAMFEAARREFELERGHR